MKVAIVGGGVGGLTAAIALSGKGIECAVYEQAPAVAATGASLQLGPNALRLMDELGLLPAAAQDRRAPRGGRLRPLDATARCSFTPRWAPRWRNTSARPQLDFFRPDLHRVLLDALPAGYGPAGVASTASSRPTRGWR